MSSKQQTKSPPIQSPKKFRKNPDVSAFYRLLYEYDLRVEAFKFLNDMLFERLLQGKEEEVLKQTQTKELAPKESEAPLLVDKQETKKEVPTQKKQAKKTKKVKPQVSKKKSSSKKTKTTPKKLSPKSSQKKKKKVLKKKSSPSSKKQKKKMKKKKKR